jgi:hypothetical protein
LVWRKHPALRLEVLVERREVSSKEHKHDWNEDLKECNESPSSALLELLAEDGAQVCAAATLSICVVKFTQLYLLGSRKIDFLALLELGLVL